MQKKTKIFAIAGPTASGKTALSIALAKQLCGEIISSDSMQLYKGMEIGTAKPTAAEMQGVPHHLLGVLEPTVPYSVADFVADAAAAAAGIEARGHRVFLVGGTGLYIRSFLQGVPFEEKSRSGAVRDALEKELSENGIEPLYARLSALDPAAAAKIHPNNHKRVLRALEYCAVSEKRFSEQGETLKPLEPPYASRMLCLTYRDRETLYARINRRVDAMLSAGLLEEARTYYDRFGTRAGTSAQAIGYKELFPFFEGQISLDEAAERIQRETRRYAKRQLTWFRREENAVWLYADDYPDFDALLDAALAQAAEFFNL